MEKLPLILLGSARKNSNTEKFLEKVSAGQEYKLLDLLDFTVSPYNYEHNYPETDNFSELADAMLRHQVLIFATPVYWYAMSGLMKTFFDRLTDLVTVKKEIGRKLKGKSVFLIAVGADEALPNGFEEPFRLTSDYLEMSYKGCIYHSEELSLKEENLTIFQNNLRSALNS